MEQGQQKVRKGSPRANDERKQVQQGRAMVNVILWTCMTCGKVER